MRVNFPSEHDLGGDTFLGRRPNHGYRTAKISTCMKESELEHTSILILSSRTQELKNPRTQKATFGQGERKDKTQRRNTHPNISPKALRARNPRIR